MQILESFVELIAAAKAWAFPISALFFCVYPVIVLVWTIVGANMSNDNRRSNAEEQPENPGFGEFAKRELVVEKKKPARRPVILPKVIGIAACACFFAATVRGLAFATVAGVGSDARHGSMDSAEAVDQRQPLLMVSSPVSSVEWSSDAGPTDSGIPVASAAAAGVAFVSIVGLFLRRPKSAVKSFRSAIAKGCAAPRPVRSAGRILRSAVISGKEAVKEVIRPISFPNNVRRYVAPAPTRVSLWHDVELRVKSWLDEDTGLFRFVNEMPLGSLQKFEVQPHAAGNAISEDIVGSTRLASFGQPVPFNYGCMPQTYRDPRQLDRIYDAPGDDDPLDIVDLTKQTMEVGQVAKCRPLGAVCLIDEGRADWKVLVVNTENPGPLADARSVEDVDRVYPGRVDECLKWMDDFKQSSGDDQVKLHFEIHGSELALSLIEQDHESWRRLVSKAGADGKANGHWVRVPGCVQAQPRAVGILPTPTVAMVPKRPREVAVLVGAKQQPGTVLNLAAARGIGAFSGAAKTVARVPPRRPGVVLRNATLTRNKPVDVASLTHMSGLVPRHLAPAPTGISLWHDIDLRVKNWFDEDSGLFRYVNEMPLGSLQKFEVQPHVEENAISEDPSGSARLAAFGRAVPFNYGCLPQTYRDPQRVDDLYGAPGDDDPLDILDLCGSTVGVGKVVHCRPLGAVCLIDEGQADWKILAVSVDHPVPLANARSIEDVERMAPGRVAECLRWIDDFKQSNGGDEAKLHFEVHDANRAITLINQDHDSWQSLVAEAGPDCAARGHWVRAPGSKQYPLAVEKRNTALQALQAQQKLTTSKDEKCLPTSERLPALASSTLP